MENKPTKQKGKEEKEKKRATMNGLIGEQAISWLSGSEV